MAGPWRTVDYQDRWLGMSDGDFLGVQFPTKWMSADGRTLWAVFNGGASGPYHDRLNIMQAVLSASARRGAAVVADALRQARQAHAGTGLDAAAPAFGLDEPAGGERLGLAVFPVGPAAPVTAEPGARRRPGPGRVRAGLRARRTGGRAGAGSGSSTACRAGPGSGWWSPAAATRPRAGRGWRPRTAWPPTCGSGWARSRSTPASPTAGTRTRRPGTAAGASFAGWTGTVAQRVGLPLRAGGGLTVTPWAGLAYARQAADGFTLEDPGLGEQRYSGVAVGEATASLGVDGELAPVRLGGGAWLRLRGGLSYTQGLVRDDYRVRVAALGAEHEETVGQPATRAVGLRLERQPGAGRGARGGRRAVGGGGPRGRPGRDRPARPVVPLLSGTALARPAPGGRSHPWPPLHLNLP